jgi:hypothetical protein
VHPPFLEERLNLQTRTRINGQVELSHRISLPHGVPEPVNDHASAMKPDYRTVLRSMTKNQKNVAGPKDHILHDGRTNDETVDARFLLQEYDA